MFSNGRVDSINMIMGGPASGYFVKNQESKERILSKKPPSSEGWFNDEIILEKLNIRRGQSILDCGCGRGYMARKFSKLVGNTGKIYALDPDREMIGNLKKEVEKESNIHALVGDITGRTELKEFSIDLAYLSMVFHMFSDKQIVGFEKEINRILRPKAQLAIVNIRKEDTPFGPPLERRYSPEELRGKLSLTPMELYEVGEHFYLQLFIIK